MMNSWSWPAAWQPPAARPPLLAELTAHTIAFITDRTPTAAPALAVRYNPRAKVLVLALAEHRERVRAMGAHWADVYAHANATRLFAYRQSAPGSAAYWRFCHVRWLALAAELAGSSTPADGAIAVLDDDVLLFEPLADRLREAAVFHPTAQAETVVSGAYVLLSYGALARFAAFLWALYALPVGALSEVVWRFGEPKPLAALEAPQRARLEPAFSRSGMYPHFTDMSALDAFRRMARTGQHLPQALGLRWAAGHVRANCTHASRLEKLQAAEHGGGRAAPPGGLASPLSPVSSLPLLSQLRWVAGVPHLAGRPLCFLHAQGPAAKRDLAPLLAAAGV